MSDTLACAHRKLIPNPSPGRYRRRGPERSVLYQAVQENQETFLAPARAQEDAPGGEYKVRVTAADGASSERPA